MWIGRGGCEGVFRRISERLSSKGSREGVFEGGCEGFFRRVSERGGYDRWIQSGRLRFIGWIGLR